MEAFTTWGSVVSSLCLDPCIYKMSNILLPLQCGFLESAGLLFSPSNQGRNPGKSKEKRLKYAALQD